MNENEKKIYDMMMTWRHWAKDWKDYDKKKILKRPMTADKLVKQLSESYNVSEKN